MHKSLLLTAPSRAEQTAQRRWSRGRITKSRIRSYFGTWHPNRRKHNKKKFYQSVVTRACRALEYPRGGYSDEMTRAFYKVWLKNQSGADNHQTRCQQARTQYLATLRLAEASSIKVNAIIYVAIDALNKALHEMRDDQPVLKP
jgi:hypothetical protein